MRCLLLLLVLVAPLHAQTLLGVESALTSPTTGVTRTACAAFIEELVDLAETPVFESPVLRVVRQGRVGMAMMARAKSMTRPDAQGREARERPVDGFKPELIANGQLGEVYRHVLGHGGAILLGTVGRGISWAAEADDRRQTRDPDLERANEARTEIVDDVVGRRVGRLIRERIRGRISSWQLRTRLRALLHA